VTVQLVVIPLGFLVGLGGFDYWLYYAADGRRGPRTTPGTARQLARLLPLNTDHKVIGIQYLVTTIVFFSSAACSRCSSAPSSRSRATQYFNPQTFNVLVSSHAALMIFLFVIPAFAGLGNYVIPLMLGAADMAFPRLNALSFWLLPIAGVDLLSRMVTPGGGPSAGWTCYAPLCSHQPLGRCSSTWASSGPARARS
jgi:cytochrome c oxidase subunit 1